MLRAAVRDVRRDVRFFLLAATLLAVTIGATTAVYAIVQAVILRPLPVTDQERVAVVWQRDLRRNVPVIEVAHDEMTDWRARTRSFEELGAMGSVNWSATLAGEAEDPVALAAVSASFFRVLGTRAIVGRHLEEADENGPAYRVMVLSHGLWTRRFGQDASIVGRAVAVRPEPAAAPIPVQIVGVMPREFDLPRGADIWMPASPLIRGYAAAQGESPDGMLRHLRVFYVLGRLSSGVTHEEAAAELTRVMRTSDIGASERPAELVVTPLTRYLIGPAGPVLWALLAGASLMFVIGCVNLGGLQVTRAARRQRVLAIQLAIGASNRHLVRQAVLVSALVSAAGVAAGTVVSHVVARLLVAAAPLDVPRISSVDLASGPVLVFALATAAASVMLTGVWPALIAARLEATSLVSPGRHASTSRVERRVQRTVVVAQIAIALMLCAGTGLFVRTVRGLDRTVLGFEPDGLLAFEITPGTSDRSRWDAFYDALLERLTALPDVTAAAGVSLRPLSGPIGWDTQPLLAGQRAEDRKGWELNPYLAVHVATPDYFDTMGIRRVRGRLFDRRDTSGAAGAVVVSESAARRLWPGQEPIGQRLRDSVFNAAHASGPTAWQTVVGVVQDVRYRGLNDVRLDLYLPAARSSHIKVHQLMLRTRIDADASAAAVRAAARSIDPGATVSAAIRMSDVVEAESAPWRFLTRVFVAFAAVAATLAAVGLGAVVALAVSSRRRELAIRAALGADPRRLRTLIARDARRDIAVGIALGLVAALAVGRSVSGLLVGIAPHDPLAFAGAAGLVAAVGAAACWWPGRRAASVNPAEALRQE